MGGCREPELSVRAGLLILVQQMNLPLWEGGNDFFLGVRKDALLAISVGRAAPSVHESRLIHTSFIHSFIHSTDVYSLRWCQKWRPGIEPCSVVLTTGKGCGPEHPMQRVSPWWGTSACYGAPARQAAPPGQAGEDFRGSDVYRAEELEGCGGIRLVKRDTSRQWEQLLLRLAAREGTHEPGAVKGQCAQRLWKPTMA